MLVEFQKNIHLVYRYNPVKFQINTKVRKTNKQNQPGTLFLRKFLPCPNSGTFHSLSPKNSRFAVCYET